MFDLFLASFGETLLMVSISGVVGALFGVPLGVLLHLTNRGGVLSHPLFNRSIGVVVNAVRSIPFIILLVVVIPFTRFIVGSSIGTTAAVVPLTIAAVPFIARLPALYHRGHGRRGGDPDRLRTGRAELWRLARAPHQPSLMGFNSQGN
jgi:ABC-type methionine transport system permease subunit